MSLFIEDMNVYVDTLKESRKTKQKPNLLQVLSMYNKTTGYKANIQKSVAFLYATMNSGILKF